MTKDVPRVCYRACKVFACLGKQTIINTGFALIIQQYLPTIIAPLLEVIKRGDAYEGTISIGFTATLALSETCLAASA